MKNMLKKNLSKIIIYFAVLILLSVSMCFCTLLDNCIYNIIATENHIIANDKMLVHFIDVGQADAVAINFPNGEIALIDTGSFYSANKLISYLDSYVMPLGNGNIDYLFFSHADEDHTGGINSVLFNYNVKNIVRPRQYANFEVLESDYDAYFEDDNDTFNNTMTMVYNEVSNGANLIKAQDLMHFNIGKATVDIFYPNTKPADSNNFSYYIKVEYNKYSLLFTGDAGKESEEKLVSKYGNLINCDVLKVAHHGSSTSSSSSFLNAVSPMYAVISVGTNDFGHPTSNVINSLKDSGVNKILRTDLEGNILFVIGEQIGYITGEFFISTIEFSSLQLSWCLTFIWICYGFYLFYTTFGNMILCKIKHN